MCNLNKNYIHKKTQFGVISTFTMHVYSYIRMKVQRSELFRIVVNIRILRICLAHFDEILNR